jgi:Flp pilus assembly protein TadG
MKRRVKAPMRLLRRGSVERGQVLVFVAVMLVPLLGMAGFVIDLGSWYQAHRHQQAIADASAIVAAGALPGNTSQAQSDAVEYAVKNDGTVAPGDISFSSRYLPNDTITVDASRVVPSFFLKLVGFQQATVRATAVARAENLGSAWGSAPFAVINTQPELSGPGCPCFGNQTMLDLKKAGPGGFKVINIDGSQGGLGGQTLADWITNGCECSTDTPVDLYSDPGAKYNGSSVIAAMNGKIGSDLLFPVYDTVAAQGAGMKYHVIAFAGFHLTGFNFNGNQGKINGYFVKVDWNGKASTNPAANYFGATTVRLVDPTS